MPTLRDVGIKVVERLIARSDVSELGAANTSLMDEERPEVLRHPIEAQVIVGSGSRPHERNAGVVVAGEVKVVVFRRSSLDRFGDASELLAKESEGLLLLADKIEKALKDSWLGGTLLAALQPSAHDTNRIFPQAVAPDTARIVVTFRFTFVADRYASPTANNGTTPDKGL